MWLHQHLFEALWQVRQLTAVDKLCLMLNLVFARNVCRFNMLIKIRLLTSVHCVLLTFVCFDPQNCSRRWNGIHFLSEMYNKVSVYLCRKMIQNDFIVSCTCGNGDNLLALSLLYCFMSTMTSNLTMSTEQVLHFPRFLVSVPFLCLISMHNIICMFCATQASAVIKVSDSSWKHNQVIYTRG